MTTNDQGGITIDLFKDEQTVLFFDKNDGSHESRPLTSGEIKKIEEIFNNGKTNESTK